jgi:hypothetical protein
MYMEDDFAEKYAGKTHMMLPGGAGERLNPHKQAWEMFTTGIEDVFGRTKSTKMYTKPEDRHVENLILGMMATLNYFDDEEGWRKTK